MRISDQYQAMKRSGVKFRNSALFSGSVFLLLKTTISPILCPEFFWKSSTRSSVKINAMSVQVSVEGHHLSIVGQGITEIPVELGQQYGESVTELDFTENAIRYAILD